LILKIFLDSEEDSLQFQEKLSSHKAKFISFNFRLLIRQIYKNDNISCQLENLVEHEDILEQGKGREGGWCYVYVKRKPLSRNVSFAFVLQNIL
jgi:hypothetical protein